jgi:hypothetical protein
MDLALIALAIFSVIATIMGIHWYRATVRREEASRFFLSRGFKFTPGYQSLEEAGRGNFFLFSRRRSPGVYNVGERSIGDSRISLFDYKFTSRARKNRRTIHFTVAEVRTAAPLPICTVQTETILSKIAQVAGYEDIDFAHDPEFSKQFVVRGAEPAQISAMLTAELREFFSTFPDLNFESGPDGFIWYTPGSLKVAQYDRMLTCVEQLDQMLKRQC